MLKLPRELGIVSSVNPLDELAVLRFWFLIDISMPGIVATAPKAQNCQPMSPDLSGRWGTGLHVYGLTI